MKKDTNHTAGITGKGEHDQTAAKDRHSPMAKRQAPQRTITVFIDLDRNGAMVGIESSDTINVLIRNHAGEPPILALTKIDSMDRLIPNDKVMMERMFTFGQTLGLWDETVLWVFNRSEMHWEAWLDGLQTVRVGMTHDYHAPSPDELLSAQMTAEKHQKPKKGP